MKTKPRLVVLVGPSGAGKDAVRQYAARKLALDPRFYFAERLVTRNSDQWGERSVDGATLHRMDESQALAQRWQAHGLEYGLARSSLEPDDPRVAVVIANISRTVILPLMAQYPAEVVEIQASDAQIRARVQDRQRESAAQIEARLRRSVSLPENIVVHHINNDGPLACAGDAFVRILRDVAESMEPAGHD